MERQKNTLSGHPIYRHIDRFRQRLTRLYEQGASGDRIGAYQNRWWRWVSAGLAGNKVLVRHPLDSPCEDWTDGLGGILS